MLLISEGCTHVIRLALLRGTTTSAADNHKIVAMRNAPAIFGVQPAIRDAKWLLAGDAVPIAPVSTQNPCKQGILQGNSAFMRLPPTFFTGNACATAGSRKILKNLSGKYHRPNSEFIHHIREVSQKKERLFCTLIPHHHHSIPARDAQFTAAFVTACELSRTKQTLHFMEIPMLK